VNRRSDDEFTILFLRISSYTFKGTFESASLLLRLVGGEKDGMVVIAQCAQHALDSAIGHGFVIHFVAVDKVLHDQIPRFPKDAKFSGCSMLLRQDWLYPNACKVSSHKGGKHEEECDQGGGSTLGKN